VQQDACSSQWSRCSWGHVFSALLAISLAWWPVAAMLHIAAICRFVRGAELAVGYILLLGVPSWLIGLLIAGSRRWRTRHQPERWMVFAVCCLPLPVIALRVPVLVARVL